MTEYRTPRIRHYPGVPPNGESSESFRILVASPGTHGGTFYCFYHGESMSPTLAEADLLEIVPCKKRSVRRGDVVLVAPPNGAMRVVHRVIQSGLDCIRTRGDNSLCADGWRLGLGDVEGRVVAAWRGGRRRRIAGGRIGWAIGHLSHLRARVMRMALPLLRPTYQFLTRTGAVRRLLPSGFRPRMVVFRAGNGTYRRLLLGRRVVGWENPHTQQWRIQRPFRLFVDEAMLAKGRKSEVPPDCGGRGEAV